jgi:hypothetical protein
MYQKHQTETNPFKADALTKKINELEREVEESQTMWSKAL